MEKSLKNRILALLLLLLMCGKPSNSVSFGLPSAASDVLRFGSVLAKRHAPLVKKTAKYGAVIAGIAAVAWFASALMGNSADDLALFFKEVAKNPIEMGAGFPSSKYLAKSAVAHLPPIVAGKELNVLEVGAGTGIMTKELVKRMSVRKEGKLANQLVQGCKLDVVELMPDLCKILEKKFGGIESVKVHCTPVEQFNPGIKYDAVVMTIPFNALPHALVKEIWTHVVSLLKDGGTISYFSYVGLPKLKKAVLTPAQRKDFQKTLSMLDTLHDQHGAGQDVIKRNVPPARVRYFEFDKPENVELKA